MRAKFPRIAISVFLLLPLLGHAQNDPAIRWRIENPFRLFRNAADFERLRMPPNANIQDWFSGIAHQVEGNFLPYRRTFWDSIDGRNVNGQYAPGYIFPTSHRIVLSWSGAKPGDRCDWQIGEHWQRNVSCTDVTADIPYDYDVTENGADAAPAGGRLPSKPVRVIVTATSSSQRQASTTIEIIDTLVLALGDSYTAGEGSPDQPARLNFTDSLRIDSPYRDCTADGPCVWFPRLLTGQPAQWWDDECHRSLLAWPVLAALRLASEYADAAQRHGVSAPRQYAVTFASYACSGAEFFDGVFTRQQNPPGRAKIPGVSADGALRPNQVQASQLRAAGADLCDFPGGEAAGAFSMRRIEYFTCPRPRKADLVLMSIGGNDAGFARVIMNGLLPRPSQAGSPVGAASLAVLHRMLGTVDIEESARRRLRMLPNYGTLETYLRRFTADDAGVFVMAYPNPLLRPTDLPTANGALGGKLGEACGLEMRAGMEAARMIGYPVVRSWWHFWFDHGEAQRTVDAMIRPLQEEVRGALPQKSNWHYVTGHWSDFEKHGLCADAVRAEDDTAAPQPTDAWRPNVLRYGLPRQQWHDGAPQRLTTQQWRPYDTAIKRWIRTPNDTLQTQTQLGLRDSLHGAFHPTGAGYAAMADAAFSEMVAHIKAKQGGGEDWARR